mmetsp:Transcript_18748/g.34555  ORF Transcript_18748/g.34555 Transcript_18748/m.34555 type:complete len:239 (+) Transcript_18748:1706-2422(+)
MLVVVVEGGVVGRVLRVRRWPPPLVLKQRLRRRLPHQKIMPLGMSNGRSISVSNTASVPPPAAACRKPSPNTTDPSNPVAVSGCITNRFKTAIRCPKKVHTVRLGDRLDLRPRGLVPHRRCRRTRRRGCRRTRRIRRVVRLGRRRRVLLGRRPRVPHRCRPMHRVRRVPLLRPRWSLRVRRPHQKSQRWCQPRTHQRQRHQRIRPTNLPRNNPLTAQRRNPQKYPHRARRSSRPRALW